MSLINKIVLICSVVGMVYTLGCVKKKQLFLFIFAHFLKYPHDHADYHEKIFFLKK